MNSGQCQTPGCHRSADNRVEIKTLLPPVRVWKNQRFCGGCLALLAGGDVVGYSVNINQGVDETLASVLKSFGVKLDEAAIEPE